MKYDSLEIFQKMIEAQLKHKWGQLNASQYGQLTSYLEYLASRQICPCCTQGAESNRRPEILKAS